MDTISMNSKDRQISVSHRLSASNYHWLIKS